MTEKLYAQMYRDRFGDPSERRALMYGFIVRFAINHHGVTPSTHEIMKGVDISSTANVRFNLDRMVAFGAIRMMDIPSRSIQVVGSLWTPPV